GRPPRAPSQDFGRRRTFPRHDRDGGRVLGRRAIEDRGRRWPSDRRRSTRYAGGVAMIDALVRALKLPDLRNKVIFTFAMLVVFRIFAHIPVPGVDPRGLSQLFQTNQLMGMLDLFSGGAMTTFS